MIHKLVSVDRQTLQTRTMKVSNSYHEIVIALSQSAIHWAQHHRHVVFVEDGFRLLDDAGKVIRVVKMQHEEE